MELIVRDSDVCLHVANSEDSGVCMHVANSEGLGCLLACN